MTDLFQTLADAPDHVLQMIGTSLEGGAKDPAQKAILESYIQDLTIDKGAVVVELGCGTGPVCRRFAEIRNVDRVIGIELAAGLVATANQLANNRKLEFHVGRAEATGLEEGTADVVVLHTLLSHVPDQSPILDETRRLLKSSGQLAVCDADFSKTSVAIGDGDPLQTCVEVWLEGNVTDRWLSPRLPGLLKSKEFEVKIFKGHNRVDITGISTGPIWVNMGANAMVDRGLIGEAAAEALKQECQRRIDDGQFYAPFPLSPPSHTRPKSGPFSRNSFDWNTKPKLIIEIDPATWKITGLLRSGQPLKK